MILSSKRKTAKEKKILTHVRGYYIKAEACERRGESEREKKKLNKLKQ